jgi:hypothetical protein
MIDNYSRSHQMYMMPIESMVHRTNVSSSSSSTDMSMMFHLQNNIHRRMNDYHHTMREIFQLIRQIHQDSRSETARRSSAPTSSSAPSSSGDNNSSTVGSRIAESILNALLQSTSSTTDTFTGLQHGPTPNHSIGSMNNPSIGPMTEASFTFALFPTEDDEEPHPRVTNAQMEQYTESYVYQPPVFTSHYHEDRAQVQAPEPTQIGEPGPEPGPESEYNHRTCPITLEEFEPGESVTKINVCGHVFRAAALRSWFEQHHLCPVCRRDIRNGHV